MCPCWLSWLYLWVCCVENQDSKFLRSTWISRQVGLFRLSVWHHKWKKHNEKKVENMPYLPYISIHAIPFELSRPGPILGPFWEHANFAWASQRQRRGLGVLNFGSTKIIQCPWHPTFFIQIIQSRVGRKWGWDNFTLRPSGMSNSDTIIYICIYNYVYIYILYNYMYLYVGNSQYVSSDFLHHRSVSSEHPTRYTLPHARGCQHVFTNPNVGGCRNDEPLPLWIVECKSFWNPRNSERHSSHVSIFEIEREMCILR